MMSVRDNGATNNDVITTTPQQKVAQCHLNYKATKGRLTLLHRSVLLSQVCRLLLPIVVTLRVGCLVLSPPGVKGALGWRKYRFCGQFPCQKSAR